MSTLFFIALLPVFFLLSAFFSLSETALLASNKYRIRHLAAQGNRRAKRLLSLLEEPETLLATILLGNNFANIGAASVSAALVSRLVSEQRRDIVLAVETVVLTILVLLFCELAPKAIAARIPERVSLHIVIPIQFLIRLLSPITKYSLSFASVFYKRVRRNPDSMTATLSDAELRTLIDGHTQDRMNMLERVLDFSQLQVRDVMVPRLEVTGLEINMPFDEILRVVEATRYSRFPVFQGTLDNVIGILHGKDLMPYLHYPETLRVSQLLRKPVFIPDTARLNNSIRLLQNAQTHLGIVIDEHGSVEGIVTLEDLIEQIVGEIQDEHDVEVDSVIPQVDGSLLIDASIAVRDLNERLFLKIPENTQYVTFAGFLLTKAGRLLKEGDRLEFDGHTCKIEQTSGRRILRVRLMKAQAARR